jgi:hypothetical protein
MSDERPAPDFAMLRAVEILASIATRQQNTPLVPPPPIDRPVILFNETQTFALGTTTRRSVERTLGIGFSYPGKGWYTYATRAGGERCLLSAFYRDGILAAVEYYLPKTNSAPALAPRDFGDFRLIPGEVTLGMGLASLDARYITAVSGPSPIVYAQAYEIRFPGGIGYVMGNSGRVERLVLYPA